MRFFSSLPFIAAATAFVNQIIFWLWLCLPLFMVNHFVVCSFNLNNFIESDESDAMMTVNVWLYACKFVDMKLEIWIKWKSLQNGLQLESIGSNEDFNSIGLVSGVALSHAPLPLGLTIWNVYFDGFIMTQRKPFIVLYEDKKRRKKKPETMVRSISVVVR